MPAVLPACDFLTVNLLLGAERVLARATTAWISQEQAMAGGEMRTAPRTFPRWSRTIPTAAASERQASKR